MAFVQLGVNVQLSGSCTGHSATYESEVRIHWFLSRKDLTRVPVVISLIKCNKSIFLKKGSAKVQPNIELLFLYSAVVIVVVNEPLHQ